MLWFPIICIYWKDSAWVGLVKLFQSFLDNEMKNINIFPDHAGYSGFNEGNACVALSKPSYKKWETS